MIGIIGYGMVGKAVRCGFPSLSCIISDPAYNKTSIEDVCNASPMAIFICVPTPTDSSNYSLITSILTRIQQKHYTGLVIVKSTVPFTYIDRFDVVYNPEFLSRATYMEDFINPPFLILGGKDAEHALKLYDTHSIVNTPHKFVTDVKTASMIKYITNSFFALKVTYMNLMYDIAEKHGADYSMIAEALCRHPWMGSNHFKVPGPDGERGFGGPCLPKDTKAFAQEFDIDILYKILQLNTNYRS